MHGHERETCTCLKRETASDLFVTCNSKYYGNVLWKYYFNINRIIGYSDNECSDKRDFGVIAVIENHTRKICVRLRLSF